jgi:hypothetical protein
MVARLIRGKKVQVTMRVNTYSDSHLSFQYAQSRKRVHELVDALYQTMRECKPISSHVLAELLTHFDEISFKDV